MSHIKPPTYVQRKKNLEIYDPWSSIIEAMTFIVQSTSHTTLQSITGKLVFRRDVILNNPFISDWEYINRFKQQLIYPTNQNENKISNLITLEYVIKG